jgi:hypothetical protein
VHAFKDTFLVVEAGPPPPPPPPPPTDSLTASVPNPFAEQSRFSVVTDAPTSLDIGVYDLQGRIVRPIFRGILPSGTRDFAWDGRRQDGSRATPGVYFYRMTQAGRVHSRRVVLLGTP